jgi:hypothetical protein
LGHQKLGAARKKPGYGSGINEENRIFSMDQLPESISMYLHLIVLLTLALLNLLKGKV